MYASLFLATGLPVMAFGIHLHDLATDKTFRAAVATTSQDIETFACTHLCFLQQACQSWPLECRLEP